MKKIILFFVCLVLYNGKLFAQQLYKMDVPKLVKTAFFKHYPGVIPFWEKEHANYEAAFQQNGKATIICFDANGNMLQTEVVIAIAELPPAVMLYLENKITNYKIRAASRITKTNGTVHYEAEVNGQDLIFDTAGNFIKAVKA
ncbi:PepSY-like domain-containing protein [Hydrotalea sp.]|uniref:PepSY-like domain-containing protein n=1 Tax=Hydrotalea sp. TaxID=2881279 RepID=UPI002590504B|nr:PepSY-like domain-containing protein [Hydrotalea sp.]